ncbi:MB12A protein, partial [Galbula dea]|nr:MB12A protein [Galbula dea]
MAAQGQAPLTGVALVAAPEAAPEGWTVLTLSVEGTAANLGKGFGHKGGGYLCVCTGGDKTPPGPVVTDVQVLSDRSPQPLGYSRVPEFPEPRKDLGHFALWCKKGPVWNSSSPPVPRPRSISSGLRQLSLQDPATESRSPLGPCNSRCGTEQELSSDSSSSYGLSALDGIPFTLHPRFESQLSSSSTTLLLSQLPVKSLADIEREYNYGFVVERTAAARLPPRVC